MRSCRWRLRLPSVRAKSLEIIEQEALGMRAREVTMPRRAFVNDSVQVVVGEAARMVGLFLVRHERVQGQ